MRIAQSFLEVCRYYLIQSQDLRFGVNNGLNEKSEEMSPDSVRTSSL
jgi:hypothetical protein